MPYRRDQFQEITETLHHLAHQVLRIPPTPDEQELDNYHQLTKQLLAEFPADGALLNPASFRSGVIEAINLLQQLHGSRETVFSSSQMPYEEISVSPNHRFVSVTIVRPTFDLLHHHPDRDFPSVTREGLFLQGDDMHMVMLDHQKRQRDLRLPSGIITATAPDQAKLVSSLTAWAINPARIRSNP
jgi:hypothetical protein